MMRFLPALRRTAATTDRPAADATTLPIPPGLGPETKVVLADYYSAVASAGLYNTYRARPWPIERAVAEGYERLVHVFKSVEAISGNAARLPFQLKLDEQVVKDHPLYRVLNKRANPLETGRQFRKRLGAQVLLSKRGAFVEVTRARNGDVVRLDLLPPGRTWPIPSADNLIDHYEVLRLDGTRNTIPAENVRWFRDPHPIDPYSGITPLEAAGMSAELDFFTRLYNTQFLKNDGRPGGIVAVKGELGPKETDKLESRFGTGPSQAGKVTVIEGDVSYVDVAARPRDMSYKETATTSKTEILTAFGVPESVIGNSSGRCLRASELVRLADGRRVPAGDLVGTRFEVMTSTPGGHTVSEAWATLEHVEPIYRITTESGRILETNGRHPLYAATYLTTKQARWRSSNGPRIDVAGWTPISTLSEQPDVGSWVIAVPSRITPAGPANDLTSDEAFVLGALVGDGSISGSKSNVALTTPEGDFPEAFIAAVEAMGDRVRPQKIRSGGVATWGVSARPEHIPGSGKGRKNSCRTRVLLRRVGLMGTTSATKFIPEEVFGAADKALAAFLGGLYAADGCVFLGKPSARTANGINSVSLVTVSERLARDVQEALLRFGVNARLRYRKGLRGGMPSMEGKRYSSWEVSVTAAADVVAFTDAITIPGKQAKLDELAKRARNTLTPKQHGGNAKRWRTKHLNPDLRWEKVTSVEPVGTDQTIGIAVPGHHTYLSVLWEHNTWDNAEQELYAFWTLTMPPFLDLLITGLDEDSEDALEGAFDTSKVEVLQRPEIARREEARSEFELGLTTPNEYREKAGYDEIDRVEARCLYLQSALKPVPTSDADAKKLAEQQAAATPPQLQPGAGQGAQGAQGGPAARPGGGQAGPPQGPSQGPSQGPPSPPAGPDAPPLAGKRARGLREGRAVRTLTRPGLRLATRPPGRERSGRAGKGREGSEVKAADGGDRAERVSDPDPAAHDRVEEALTAALTTLHARLLARTAARITSPKARKGTRHWTPGGDGDTRTGTKALDGGRVVDGQRWRYDAAAAAAPILAAAAVKAATGLLVDLGAPTDDIPGMAAAAGTTASGAAVAAIGDAFAAAADRLAAAITAADGAGRSLPDIQDTVAGQAQQAGDEASWVNTAAATATTGAVVAARDAAATALQDRPGAGQIARMWRARLDARTRGTHRTAHGQHQPLDTPFDVGGAKLRYPGDPDGPPGETINCRCGLQYRHTPSGRYMSAPAGAAEVKAPEVKALTYGGRSFAVAVSGGH